MKTLIHSNNYRYRRSQHFLFLTLLVVIASLYPALSAQAIQTELKVVSELANIRVSPDIGSTIIHMAPQGTIFTALGKEGDWYRIRYLPKGRDEAITGFVHESLVLEIGEPLPSSLVVPKQDIRPPEKKTEPQTVKKPEIPEPEKPAEKPKPPPQKEPVAVKKPPVKQDFPAPSQPQAKPFSLPEKRPPISLSLSGGGKYAEGGDINAGALGIADFYNATLPGDQVGEVKPLHLSYIIGGEIALAIHPNLTIGLGADYFIANSQSSVAYAGGETDANLTVQPEINVLPIRISLSCFVLPEFYIKSGIEYHLAKCSYIYRFQQGDYWKQYQGEADARGLGIMAGFGYVADLSPNLGFFIETMGRYARVMDFQGQDFLNDSTGLESQEEGYLYIFKSQTSPDTTHDLLFIREKKPSEAGVSDPQKATINFTGVSLRAGIILRF